MPDHGSLDVQPPGAAANPPRELVLRFPIWLNPIVLLLAIPVFTAIAAVFVPASSYAIWLVPKYLGSTESALLLTGLLAIALGMLVGMRFLRSNRASAIGFAPDQIRWLQRAYTICLGLTIFGYIAWFLVGLRAGVGFDDLVAVVRRDPEALAQIKLQSRPIAGLTTWTQVAPIVVALGVVLYRLGIRAPGALAVLALSAVRALFYGERLALLETAIPAVILLAVTTSARDKLYKYVRAAPIVMPPAVWGLFAALEYTRSWVHYQNIIAAPFVEWVTIRLIGYYTTGYNNSALIYNALPAGSTPYFSIDAFWNAPGISYLFPLGLIGNLPARDWWFATLRGAGNVEFTNPGSILVVLAEFGVVVGVMAWALWGFAYGRIFAFAVSASAPGLIAYCVLAVGVLELPRFNYLTLGRCTPILLVLAVFALTYPKDKHGAAERT